QAPPRTHSASAGRCRTAELVSWTSPGLFATSFLPGSRTMSDAKVTHYRWNDMPVEEVAPLLGRRLITGEKMMLAHVYLKKGCIVPKHQHHNEQLTYILEGALHFFIGEDGT